MKPWLAGDFSGVDVRRETARIRDTIFAAAHRGEDLTRLVRGLAEADARACAEVTVGPKAVAHPSVVKATLEVAPLLEGEVAPSGLYSRLADLGPSVVEHVLLMAARRHPVAGWWVHFSQRWDPCPGRTHLEETAASPHFEQVCVLYATAGIMSGLLEFSRANPDIRVVAALYRAGCVDSALSVAAVVLEEDEAQPVVGALAALHGPDLSFLGQQLLTKLDDSGIRERVQRVLMGG